MTLEELLTAVAELSEEEKAQLMTALAPATDEDKTEEETSVKAEDEDEPLVDEAKDEGDPLVEEVGGVTEAAAEAEAAKAEGDNTAAVEASEEAVQNAEEVLAATEELRDKIAEDSMKKAIRHIDNRNRMLARVKPFIGAIPATAMDSAESIAAYFLKKKGVKFAKGQATAVTMGYLHGRKPASETVAQDSKPVTQNETITALWGKK